MKTDIFVEKNKLLLNLTLPAHVLAAEADEKKMIRNYFQNKLNGFLLKLAQTTPHPLNLKVFILKHCWDGMVY